jgi:predicted enzyme related to lactoylglutathione lyase
VGATAGTANPFVHFEIIGRDPATLRSYYKQMFG